MGCCAFTDGHSIEAIGTSYTYLPKLDITNSEKLRKSIKAALEQTVNKEHLVKNPAKIDAFMHGVALYFWRHFKKEEIIRKTS